MMANSATRLMVLALWPMALSMKLNGAPAKTMLTDVSVADTAAQTVSQMETVFARSEQVQHESMDRISKSMSLASALEVVQKSSIANSSTLSRVTGLLSKKSLRKHLEAHDGFGGLDGARLLLNDMIHEVLVKYDAEIAKCTAYYASQCALMEVARGQISAANYIAATSRALILDAQYNINHCEISIPETKLELKDHNAKCKAELKKLNEKLVIIMNDIAVMTMILEMSDCDAKFLQTKKLVMLKCKDQCTNKHTVIFNHKALQQQVSRLKSKGTQNLLSETFADMFDDDSVGSVELMQVEGSEYMEPVVKKAAMVQANQAPPAKDPLANSSKTAFNNPPIPRTKVPANPCTDPDKGAPSAANKRAAKCTLKKSPRCYKLQGRFLQIQAEIADSRDELMTEISKLENSCAETKKSLEASIKNDKALLGSSQTKLGTATEKEAAAGETGRQVATENQQYNDDLVKQMKTCSTNYIDFETELCALRKIRGDLFKKMKPGHPGFFQDCEVSPWAPEACTAVCEGGDQKLTRSVLTHPNGGCKCLPLSAERRCNLHPCPVNCVLAEWSGWSKCSSKCGGGMAGRVRDVKVPEQYGGKQCGETGQSKQCNVDACEKDCVLHPWTKWTACSKDCDGGSQRRERIIREPAEGAGTCADKWDPSRLQYEECAGWRCSVPDPDKVMKCNTSMDVVLVLDGTPKNGKASFAAEIEAANKFVEAWTPDEDHPNITGKPQFSIIHYTGPRTWSGVSKCTGKSAKKVDMEAVCKITLVQHFTDDLKKTKAKLNGLEFQKGSKLLSLALMTVQAEFALGDKNLRTVVVVFMDGVPLSYRKTRLASHEIRKKARLVFVALTKFAPLGDVKKWVSRRWQENLVQVADVEELAWPETGTHIIANICPAKYPKLKFARMPSLEF